jgi:peptidoglycan/LPS O-acetylase OafA/YrhL
MKSIPNITSLRFFLAILVLLFHIPQFCEKHELPFIVSYKSIPLFNRGVEAVFMFFSLSGFLIIRQLYLEKVERKTISLKKFFLRRILRIFPLYYLILTIGLLHYHVILPFFGFTFENNYNLVEGILLSIFFMPNIFADLYHPGGIIEVLWSIGIEEQFYLFIAPLLLVVPTSKIKKFLMFFTLLYLLLFFNDNFSFLRQFQMCFFYFSCSGFISLLLINKTTYKFEKQLKYLIYLLLLLYFTTDIFKDNFNPIQHHFFGMILFGATLGTISLKPIPLLETKLLNYLGSISYGIYMYHAIVIQIAGFIYLKKLSTYNLSNELSILIFYLLSIMLTISLAHFSYKYFEMFFLKMKKKYNYHS